MQFNVELSELAEKQYDNILSYISNVLKNPQALENVMNDFDDTVGKKWVCIRLNLQDIDICLSIVLLMKQ